MDQNPTPEQTPMPPQTEAPAPVAPMTENPGKTMGIVGLVLSLVGLGPVGIVLGIIGLRKSAAASMKNGFALAGIIVGAISTVFGIAVIAIVVTLAGQLIAKCADAPTGTSFTSNGTTYVCNANGIPESTAK